VTFRVLTLFPRIFEGYAASSIVGKTIGRGRVQLDLVNVRDYALDRHRSCDDAPYGGGAGMVLKPEPLARAIESVHRPGVPVIYLSPAGRLFDQRRAQTLARGEEVMLICGRYEGVDQRVIDLHVTEELSVGDYVLAGGEVAAMVVIDAVTRLLEGVIAGESLREESFQESAAGPLLEYPHYTRPEAWRGLRVPEVLLSGHHAQIAAWRRERSLEKTRAMRPELLPSGAEADRRGTDHDGVTQGDENGCDQSG
jgi:tRNA (guanine37-N1)-methyltransferase